jgi:signal transduction histidine kinase/ligand-binding sensor domain-containing protein
MPLYGQKVDRPLQQHSRVMDEFLHTAWTVNEGAPSATVALAQTVDGYLWLGSPTGLVRFDGIRFEHFETLPYKKLPFSDVSALLATPDGGLWIGYRTGGASFLKAGHVDNYGEKEGLPSAQILKFVMDGEGAIWMATSHGLMRFDHSHWTMIGAEQGFTGGFIEAFLFDHKGRLWIGTRDSVFLLPPHTRIFQAYKVAGGADLGQTPDGTVWMWRPTMPWTSQDTMPQIAPGQGKSYSATNLKNSMSNGPETYTMGAATDGTVWTNEFGPRQGITRIPRSAWPLKKDHGRNDDAMERFTHQDGLTDDTVSAFLEDREGNIWIATRKGLDRFRRENVHRGPAPIGDTVRSSILLPDEKGALWAARADGNQPFTRIQNDTVTLYGKPRKAVSLYRAGDGTIWIGGFATLTKYAKGRFEDVAVPADLRPGESWKIQAIAGDTASSIWVSIIQNGVYRLKDGQWRKFGGLEALPHLTAVTLFSGADGRVWFGYMGNRMAVVDRDNVRTFSAAEGLAVGNVLAITARGDHVWAGGQSGLALFDGNRFRMIATDADGAFNGVSGIVETPNGDVWLNQAAGVAHISAAEINSKLSDQHHLLRYQLFDNLDGLQGTATQLSPLPSAILGTDGKIWVGGTEGVSWIDPARIYKNPLPPPVSVQSVIADGRTYQPNAGIELPPLSANVAIAYTALSLSIPERVQFRYKLDGVDKEWQDVGTRRTAFYTNLGPDHYTFHVIACNNDGVWNETGAAIGFLVRPAFYQTAWFRLLCVALGGACLWLIYLYRVKQVTTQVQQRLGARLQERERIARELHDTLLQGFQGLILRFQAVLKKIPEREPAHQMMEQTLDRADEVLLEGRERVRDLRNEGTARNDLANNLARYGEELALDHAARFSLAVVGVPQPIDPTVSSEACSIGREALANAFQHANAANIEAEITYGRTMVRLTICDDGCGLDSETINRGRVGHWGLSGMRERAQTIGARMAPDAQLGAGTEIDLTIPAKNRLCTCPKSSWLASCRERGRP